MRWKKQIRLRLRSLFFRGRVEKELQEEFEFHLERQVEVNLAAGLSPQGAPETLPCVPLKESSNKRSCAATCGEQISLTIS
jgi:hypothetical protein